MKISLVTFLCQKSTKNIFMAIFIVLWSYLLNSGACRKITLGTLNTGEKPFPCGICDKAFSKASLKKRHTMLMHTDEKPHSCQYCDKKFGLHYNMKMHEKRCVMQPNLNFANKCPKNQKLNIKKYKINAIFHFHPWLWRRSAFMEPPAAPVRQIVTFFQRQGQTNPTAHYTELNHKCSKLKLSAT